MPHPLPPVSPEPGLGRPARLLRYLARWLPLAGLVGVLAGSASALILVALEWATATREAHLWLVAGLPLAGSAVGWLYLRFGAGTEAGSNLLIDRIHQPEATVPLRMAPLVLLGTVASHLCGASVGREGTAVQMGGALADQTALRLRLGPDDRRRLLMAGIGAGFASVFGTPLAGAVFGLEVVRGRAHVEAVLPCLLAALVADRVTSAWGVHHTVYPLGAMPGWSLGLLAAALVAGLAFGLVARVFVGATHALAAALRRAIPYAPWRPLLGGAVIAITLWATGAWRYAGLGIPGIVEAFVHPVAPWDFLAKTGFTVAALGSGFKGGEVTPLFYIGATLGNALAPLLQQPFGVLAALGFVGVFAGAAHTPLACTVMAMELFGIPICVPAALACAASHLVSGPAGIYGSRRPAPRQPH